MNYNDIGRVEHLPMKFKCGCLNVCMQGKVVYKSGSWTSEGLVKYFIVGKNMIKKKQIFLLLYGNMRFEMPKKIRA